MLGIRLRFVDLLLPGRNICHPESPRSSRGEGSAFFALLTLAFCLAALPLGAQAQSSSQQTGDPVADAARKAREQKKDQSKPKKVFDDDNIPRAPRANDQSPTPSQPSGQAPAQSDAQGQPSQGQAAQSQPGQGGAKEKEKTPEEIWRERFKAQHDRIATVEKELDILQRESEKAQLEYYPDPQKALSEQNTRKDVNEKNAKIAAKRQELATLKQGLADLEDELRKSGGDIGWSR